MDDDAKVREGGVLCQGREEEIPLKGEGVDPSQRSGEGVLLRWKGRGCLRKGGGREGPLKVQRAVGFGKAGRRTHGWRQDASQQ